MIVKSFQLLPSAGGVKSHWKGKTRLRSICCNQFEHLGIEPSSFLTCTFYVFLPFLCKMRLDGTWERVCEPCQGMISVTIWDRSLTSFIGKNLGLLCWVNHHFTRCCREGCFLARKEIIIAIHHKVSPNHAISFISTFCFDRPVS